MHGAGMLKSSRDMTKNRWRGLACALGLALLPVATSASAKQDFATAPALIAPLPPSGGARPVPAWNAFCERYAHACETDVREPDHIVLSDRVWKLLVSVNREVNAAIRPLTDIDQWGVVDRWDLAESGSGDCEDFQLLKRERLVAAGLPRRALRMTVVLDERNEGHAVLKVLTDRGEFVLDNVHDEVRAWDRTPYVYVKREGQGGRSWVSLGGVVAGPAVVAGTRR